MSTCARGFGVGLVMLAAVVVAPASASTTEQEAGGAPEPAATAQADTTATGTAADTTATAPGTDAQTADSAGGESPAPPTEAQEDADERIRAELQAIFDRVASLQGIDLAVSAGVVALSGEVPAAEHAERAAELARSREGVVYVDDTDLLSLTAAARLEDVGSRLRDKGRDVLLMLPLLGVAIVIVTLFGGLAWLVGRGRFGRGVSDRSPFLGAMVQRVVQFGLVVTGLVAALELLDATALVGAVVGTAGLAGLALGFAFKDIAENYLAGIILSLRNPFAKNDLIVVGAHEGKVVRLTGRETILMTPEGNHVQIPNATVFREPMVNYSRNPLRRFRVDVGVAADTVLSDALDAGADVLRAMAGVTDEPPPEGVVWELGDSTTTVRYFGWVDQRKADFMRVRSEAMRLVKAGLEERGIELPEPQYRLRMVDGSGAAPASEAVAGTTGSPATDVVPREGADVSGREVAEVARREAAEHTSVAGTGEPATGRLGAAAQEEKQRDVSVDRTLDEQIEAERRVAAEEDLLSESEAGREDPGEGDRDQELEGS